MFLQLGLMFVLGQPVGTAAVGRELHDLENRLAATWQAGDCAAWASLLAPDWSVIHVNGETMTKSEALESCRAPRAAPVTLTVDDLEARVFGDAAVVTGRTTVRIGGAEPSTLTLRFTDVFIRGRDGWRVVASHATRVAP